MAEVQGHLYGPIEVYTAPVGTARPDIGATPGAAWTLLGRGGSVNYGDAGVTIAPSQSIEYQRALGTTGPTDARRTEEDVSITVTLHDESINVQALLHNNAAITQQAAAAGVAGSSRHDIYRGPAVHRLALLCRGSSSPNSNDDDHVTQYWIPRVVVNAHGGATFVKNEVVQREVEFMALYDTTDGFGVCEVQTADRG